jgi:hypothetical protein
MPDTAQPVTQPKVTDDSWQQAEKNLVDKIARLQKMEQNDHVKSAIARAELYLTNIRQQSHAK